MTHGVKTGVSLLAGMMALVSSTAMGAQCQDPSTIIRNVTAYVGANLERREHVDVVIEHGRIKDVRSSRQERTGKPCEAVIDGKNLFLTPGLFDLHVHVTKTGPEFLERFPTIGLTSVRDMGSSIDEINELRRRGRNGLEALPHISSPGAMFESHKTMVKIASEKTLEPWTLVRQEIRNEEDVKKAIAEHKKAGVNFIKIRSATNAHEYRMVAQAANAVGLRVASHPPPGIRPEQLRGLDIASIEHGSYPYPVVGGDTPVDKVAEAFVSQHITIVPTLIAWKSQVENTDEIRKAANKSLNDPDLLKFIPPRLAVEWSYDISRRKQRSDKAEAAWHDFYKQLVTDLRALHQHGVHLAAGSDIGVESVVPGVSALQEMCMLHTQVGVSARDILKANTSDGAVLAGLDKVTGRIETGLSADLVLWARDPAKSINRAIPSIKLTFLRGREFHPPRDLGRLVEGACKARNRTGMSAGEASPDHEH